VHFISDVVGGYLVGAVILFVFLHWGAYIEKALQSSTLRIRVIIAAALSFLMNLLLPQEPMISGIFFGAAIGFAYASDHLAFEQKGNIGARILRYAIGLGSTALLYFVLQLANNLLSSLLGHSQDRLLGFVNAILLGGWLSYGAPSVFVKAGLLQRGRAEENAEQTEDI